MRADISTDLVNSAMLLEISDSVWIFSLILDKFSLALDEFSFVLVFGFVWVIDIRF
jgi:hypothetical protein